MSEYKLPYPFLKELIGSQILVQLKWNQNFIGYLQEVDEKFHVTLTKCNEVIKNKPYLLGKMLIRNNNIRFISKFDEDLVPEKKIESLKLIEFPKGE